MADIRDAKGNLLGRVKDEGSRTVLRDSKGNMLGRVSGGVTYDSKGNKVGPGDQLGRLMGK